MSDRKLVMLSQRDVNIHAVRWKLNFATEPIRDFLRYNCANGPGQVFQLVTGPICSLHRVDSSAAAPRTGEINFRRHPLTVGVAVFAIAGRPSSDHGVARMCALPQEPLSATSTPR